MPDPLFIPYHFPARPVNQKLRSDNGKRKIAPSVSPPIGAAAQLDTMPWRGHLEDGDILVMITDGVLEYLKGDRPADILGEIICAIREPDPERFSKELLREVLARTEGKIYDDMTVLTIRAWET